jgi:uncharacterized damage-inducible protein DinB
MNFYGAKELADSFRTVRKNTILVAEDIPEGKYSFRAAPETRSVAELLTHIALMPSMPERIHGTEHLSTLEGFDFFTVIGGLIAKEKEPRTKAQVIDLLRKEGDRFAGWLGGLKDDFLAERVTFPAGMTPPSKTRFEMLLGAKEHEMHHRGQLMLIERMVGVVPHLTRDMMARIEEMQKAKAGA